MKIELKEIKVRDLFEGYKDEGDVGSVVGYSGKLNNPNGFSDSVRCLEAISIISIIPV